MKRIPIILICICLISVNVVLAEKDKVLIKIGENTITKSEFERIFRKNNTSSVFDNKSVEEYLELFINYKLKVIEAERLGYDTINSFKKELEGYRNKLAEPYLENPDIYESFINRSYERLKTQVSASHILIRLDKTASFADTAKAYERIMQIRERIINGEPFEKVAAETSDDIANKDNGGYLGWFSAFRMISTFENVAYTTPEGEISMPLRSRYGYHIVKIHGKRLSKGKILLAHLLVRTPNNGTEEEIKQSKEKIYKYYQMLQEGEEFVDLVERYSEDNGSAKNKGLLRWIKSGILPDSLENVVFNLQNKGDLSEPVRSGYGWHIFQLQEKEPVGTIEKERDYLERKLQKGEMRIAIKAANVNHLKKENNFIEYKDNLAGVREAIDSALSKGDRDLTAVEGLVEPIFKIGNKEYFQKDLAEYISGERFDKGKSVDYVVDSKYKEFVDEKVFEYEISLLETKYPELGYLMEEYHDGILLFNLTDDVIWSKAVIDTAGLEEFYEKNKSERYKWTKRADVSLYILTDSSLTEKARELALKRSGKEISKEELVEQLCPVDTVKCVEIEDNLFEPGDNSMVDNIAWEANNSEILKKDDKSVLVVINNIREPEIKPLGEIRGIVTADYQTYLEKEWVNELRNKYSIEVDMKVLRKVK